MPTKKKDKKSKKKNIKQTQSQVVNVYTTKRTARTKGVTKAPVSQAPVSQAPNFFSLADLAKLIPNYIPQQVSKRSDSQTESFNPIPVPINKPIPVTKPSADFENLVYTNLHVASEDMKLKKMITKKPKKAILPLPKKTPAVQLPTNEAVIYNEEQPVVEERILTLLPPPQEILRQIKEKNKPRPRLIIEDDDESENVVISTQPPVAPVVVPKRVRRTKQQIDEAKQMKIEEIESRRNN